MPDWKAEVRTALNHLNLEPGREESVCEELAQHLSEQYADMIENGVPQQEAYTSVLQGLRKQTFEADLAQTFASEASSTESESGNQGSFLTGLGKDLRLAVRQLRLSPGFAVVAIASLALGIGANTAIFELIDAVLLRTLPVPDPQSLAEVKVVHQGRMGDSVARQDELSSALWAQLQHQRQGFSSIGAWSTERFNLGRGGESRYADGLWASGSFFQTLQVRPIWGRLFSEAQDNESCGAQAAVISYSFWQGEFAGNRDVLGRAITVNGRSFPIIGVTGPGFAGIEVGHKFDVALPLCSEPLMHPEDSWTNRRTTWWLAAIGRLKPEWSVQRASAQLSSVSPGVFSSTVPTQYDPTARTSYLHFRLRVAPAATGVSSFRNDYQRPLFLLLGISGLVLLIACANLANLMLARASARRHEIALRFAVGASRFRIVRQLCIESLLVSALGAALGVALAHALGRTLIAGISTSEDQVFVALSLDWRVLLFTSGLAVFTCMLFGIVPAFHASKIDPGAVIKGGGRGLKSAREGLLLRRAFTISQVALSFASVVVALLFVRTFRNLVTLNAGFKQDRVLIAAFDFSGLQVPVQQRLSYKLTLLEQVRSIPGVLSAARTNVVPLSGNRWNDLVDVPNTAIQRRVADFSSVTSDYFRTLAIPIRAGRDFTPADTPNSPPAAIVNKVFAKAFLGGINAVGKEFGVRQDAGKPDKSYQVIAVVGNTKYWTLREDYGPIAFLAETQDAAPDPYSTILVRSDTELASLTSSLKTVAAKTSPEMVLHLSVLKKSIRQGLGRERLIATLSGFYGSLAVLLSVVGLYGVMSYTVLRRTGEIGVRIALGASQARMLGMIVSDALKMVGIGLFAGTILVMAAGRALQSMLFGLSSTDPVSVAAAMAGVTVVAILASLLPAQRAAKIDPIHVLRQE